MEFAGKVALVTGGGRGLGRATALALAEQGARIVALARTLNEVVETARLVRKQYGVGSALAVRADVASEQEVAAAFAAIRRRWGGIDILVNNAGITGPTRPVISTGLGEWERALAVNLTGAFLCSREALRDMSKRRWGRIVNVSSGSAVAVVPSMAAYSVSKAALEHFTRLLAVEAAPLGVRVLAVRPGIVDTRMHEEIRARPSDEIPNDLRAMYAYYKAKGMLVPPERPAQVIAYLCSERAGDVSGRVLDAEEIDTLLTR